MDASALDPLHRIGVDASRLGHRVGRVLFGVQPGGLPHRRVRVGGGVGGPPRLRIALFLTVTVLLSGAVTEIAKNLVDRPRPAGALVSAYSTSFPSGHALGVLVAVAALLAVAWPAVGGSRRRRLAALGVVIVVAIGVGRVVLNVHHPSDVLAGWALGYAYFVACLSAGAAEKARTEAVETPAVPVIDGEARFVDLDTDLTVVGQHGGSVDRGEAELGHPHLVVQRAAGQPAQSQGGHDARPCEPLPVSRIRMSIRPSSMRVRREGAKPDGR